LFSILRTKTKKLGWMKQARYNGLLLILFYNLKFSQAVF
jgi:hypothetical protein